MLLIWARKYLISPKPPAAVLLSKPFTGKSAKSLKLFSQYRPVPQSDLQILLLEQFAITHTDMFHWRDLHEGAHEHLGSEC